VSAVLEAREPTARYLKAVQPALVRRFELISTAPGGVERLRELILTLAVQGKLVDQDPSDEPADRLVARVQAARSKLVASGQIGKQKPSEPINEDETAFLLPKGWVWSRVGDLAWPQAGFAFKSTGFNESGMGLPLIRIRDVGAGVGPTTFFSGEYRAEFLVKQGDWLISMDGEFRVRPWHATTALLNQRVTRLVFVAEEVHAAFVAAALQRELTALQGTKAYTTVDHLSGKQIGEAVIALPPANEQARIVARVDELMRLCDALEAKGRLETEQHARLLGTLLGTLTASGTPEELAANWQRVADHFDLLLDRPEAVAALEQAILQLAVRGLLVHQDPGEEPAHALLLQIQSDKRSLLTYEKVKADKSSPPINENEVRFALPPGWSWARLSDICTAIVDCPHSTAKFVDTGLLCLDTNSFKDGKLLPHKLRFVSQETFDERIARLKPEPGDLVFAREGSVGQSIIIPDGIECCLGQRVMLFRLSQRLSNEFVRLAITTEDFLEVLLGLHKGIGAKHVNVADMRNAVVPVPPYREQERILARVSELRRLCADLRLRLSASQTTQAHLAEALVTEVA
jgi:type I restriction enzyme S subunit